MHHHLVALGGLALRRVPVLALATAVVSLAHAQVSDGHYVTAHLWAQSVPGLGGLWIHHPRGTGSVAVVGLPVPLTGPATNGNSIGANAVALLPDGSLAVGELANTGATLHVYHLGIAGGSAVGLRPIPLGSGTSNRRSHVAEIEVLGPDRILVAVGTLASGVLGGSGPLAGHHLGIVTLSTSAVQACPLPAGVVGVANAVAGAGRWAYVALVDSTPTPPNTHVWKVDCTSVVGPVRLLTLTGVQINGLELDRAGNLAALGQQIYTIDPNTGVLLAACPINGNAFAFETVTGMVAGVDGSTASQNVWSAAPCAIKTVIASPPASGWGLPAGIDVVPDPIAYGAPTPLGGPDYRFVLDPNPGGLPLVGSAGFSLSVQAKSGGAAAGVWLISAGAQLPPVPVMGIDLLVALQPALVMIPSPASPNLPALLPLPIPPGLFPGAALHIQTVHIHGAGLAASEGVRVTLL